MKKVLLVIMTIVLLLLTTVAFATTTGEVGITTIGGMSFNASTVALLQLLLMVAGAFYIVTQLIPRLLVSPLAKYLTTISKGVDTLQDALPSLKTGGPGMIMDGIRIFCIAAEKLKDTPGQTPAETQAARHNAVKELVMATYGAVNKEQLTEKQSKALDSMIEAAVKIEGLAKTSFQPGVLLQVQPSQQ